MGNDLAIDNSIFANNEAALNSAAISFSGNSLLVNNSEFKSNRAKEFAGAVGVDDAFDVRFINTEFHVELRNVYYTVIFVHNDHTA